MQPWSRLTRNQAVIDAPKSTVKVEDNAIQWIEAANGRGVDKTPSRDLDYSADSLHVTYNDNGEIQAVTATGHAKVVARGATSVTTVGGDTVLLAFMPMNGDTVLTAATATGHGSLEATPVPDPRGDTPDTRVIKSDVIDINMKPGGRELDKVNTREPGTLEFLPNQITHHRRMLRADLMSVAYGARNEIQSFHATAAATETYPPRTTDAVSAVPSSHPTPAAACSTPFRRKRPAPHHEADGDFR